MSITVHQQIVAEARIQVVAMRPIVGAYQLHFVLDIHVSPETNEAHQRRVSILGAHVTLKTESNPFQSIGFARPERLIEIKQSSFQRRDTPALVLTVQPGQLAAIERLRDRGDLTFELLAEGTGFDPVKGEGHVQEKWEFRIARSEWLTVLRGAKARDILLLEVPLPLLPARKKWAEITKDLQQADACFRDGDRRGCVALCRTVIQELGQQKFGQKSWAGPLLTRLASDRDSMTVDERQAALWAAARHYAHLAHHSASEGGHSDWSRADAQFILTLVASLVAQEQAL